MAEKDIRGELKVDPKVELKDYSGPFDPDLRRPLTQRSFQIAGPHERRRQKGEREAWEPFESLLKLVLHDQIHPFRRDTTGAASNRTDETPDIL